MPKLYIISVGTSLFTNYAKEGKEGEQGEKDLAGSLPAPHAYSDLWKKPPEQWPGYNKPRFYAEGPGPAQWALRRWGAITSSSDQWPHQTAEIASLARIDLRSEDRLCLLASSTPRGMFSALVNAYLLSSPGIKPQVCEWTWEPSTAKKNTIDVDWGAAALTSMRPLSCASDHPVQIIPIQGLDPGDRESFETQGVYQLIRSLVYFVISALGKKQKIEPEIIFTGGFKASVPIITQAAIWIADCWDCSMRMKALYEDSQQLVSTPILANRPSKDACRAALAVRVHHDRNYIHKDLANLDLFATAQKPNVGSVEPSLQPLFTGDPATKAPAIKLSVLGEALIAIIETLLSGETAVYWRNWLRN